MKLTFYGACRQVTGSCYLLETGDAKVLIDCGMIQGERFTDRANEKPFPFNAAEIDAVCITHAHIDHCGRIPQLIREGFTGQVISTSATLAFVELMLSDSAHVILEEAKKHGHAPLYTESEVAAVLQAFRATEYHQPITIGSLTCEWFDAGHILGSGFIQVTDGERKLVFSGDLGNPPVPLLRDTESLPADVDYVVMESTYGNRLHETDPDRKELLRSAIIDTIERKGVLLIPAFSLERTQEVLYELNQLVERGQLPRVPIYVDSPLAIQATRLYPRFNSLFDREAAYLIHSGDDIFNFPGLTMTRTVTESKKINTVSPPKVILAGSGMMQGGRIRQHLKQYIEDPNALILIIGYQVAGSLGRQIIDRARTVTIDKKVYSVNAGVRAIGGYSAHADQAKLVEWLKPVHQLKRIWLTHGEPEAANALAQIIQQRYAIPTVVPQLGDSIELA